jgi:hypothetical protein
MPHTNTPRLTRIYDFLTYQCHIPLAPEHYLDLLVLLVLSGMCFVLCIGSGGEDPAALARASRLCAMALGFHLLVLAWRARTGFNLQSGSLLFLPWLAWCAFDWAFISPKPWQAEISFITNCMAFIAFSVSLHHFRDPLLKWLVGGIIGAFAVVMVGLALGTEVHLLDWLNGRREFQPLGGTLKRPVSVGVVLLLVFFPCIGVALGLRWRHWQRLLAIVASVVLLIGILATAHIGVIAGLFTGILIASYLFTRKFTTRAALIIPAAFALLGFCGLNSDTNNLGVGFNRLNPDYHEARKMQEVAAKEAWEKEEAGNPTPSNQKPQPLDIDPVFSLPRAALHAALEKPLQGQGTAGFAADFEQNRPVAWSDTPRSPGSLPLALFAEDGLIGSALFFAPVAWLWFSVLRACVALPRRERRKKDPGSEGKVPPVPEDRLFLASTFAGSTAAGIALVFDYPGSVPAVACLVALLAGAMYRHVRATPLRVPGGWNKEIALIVAAVLVSVAWLAWTRAPLKSASFAEKSLAAVSGTLSVVGIPNAATISDAELKARLDYAEENAHEALRANPRNADAWHVLALVALRRFEKFPDQGPSLGALARHATQKALESSPDNFEFRLAHGHALQMTGDEVGARFEYEEALHLAPGNAIAALDYAGILARDGTTFAQDKARGILRTSLHHNPLPNTPPNKALQQRLNLLHLGSTSDPKSTTSVPATAHGTTPPETTTEIK